jgi:hypothetical protein
VSYDNATDNKHVIDNGITANNFSSKNSKSNSPVHVNLAKGWFSQPCLQFLFKVLRTYAAAAEDIDNIKKKPVRAILSQIALHISAFQ